MITTRIHRLAAIAGLLWAGISMESPAQGHFGSAPQDPTRGLGQILGTSRAFSATARTVIQESPRANTTTNEFQYATADGNTRVEMDMTQFADAEAAATMRTIGMDRFVIVQVASNATRYLMYPGAKAYCDLPNGESTTATTGAGPVRTVIGNETVDGHPCVKVKLTTTHADGTTSDSLAWEATDLNNFPIQCQVPTKKGGTSTTLFKDLQTDRPAASQFEPPSTYKKYGSIQEMMMGSMQQMMQ